MSLEHLQFSVFSVFCFHSDLSAMPPPALPPAPRIPYNNPFLSEEFRGLVTSVVDELVDETSKKIIGKKPDDANVILCNWSDKVLGRALPKWNEK